MLYVEKSHYIFKEQRIVIKFLVKSGKTGAEIKPMLNNVYGKATNKKSAVYDWIQSFRDGQEGMNDDLRSGQHTETSNTF